MTPAVDPDYKTKVTLFEVGIGVLAVLILLALLLWALGPDFRRRQRQEARGRDAQRALTCYHSLAEDDSMITVDRAWWICHPLEDRMP